MINNALGNYPLTKCSYSSLTAMVRCEPATIIFAKLKVIDAKLAACCISVSKQENILLMKIKNEFGFKISISNFSCFAALQKWSIDKKKKSVHLKIAQNINIFGSKMNRLCKTCSRFNFNLITISKIY